MLKKDLKEIISVEETHRKPFEEMNEVWGSRLKLIEMMGFENIGNIMIMNEAGQVDVKVEKPGSHTTLADICEKHNIHSLLRLQQIVATFDRTIKSSVMKEKFYRYVYNMDLKKAEKYHTKCSENALEDMEDFSEGNQEGQHISLNVSSLDGSPSQTVFTAGEAHRRLCEESQKGFKHRAMMIELIKKIRN